MIQSLRGSFQRMIGKKCPFEFNNQVTWWLLYSWHIRCTRSSSSHLEPPEFPTPEESVSLLICTMLVTDLWLPAEAHESRTGPWMCCETKTTSSTRNVHSVERRSPPSVSPTTVHTQSPGGDDNDLQETKKLCRSHIHIIKYPKFLHVRCCRVQWVFFCVSSDGSSQ